MYTCAQEMYGVYIEQLLAEDQLINIDVPYNTHCPNILTGHVCVCVCVSKVGP